MSEKPRIRRMDGPVRRVVRAPASSAVNAPLAPTAPPPRAEADVAPRATSAPLHRSRWEVLTSWSRRKTAITVSSLVAVVVVALGIQAVMASQRVITKAGDGAPALKGAVDPTKLKGEGDGRINILLLGVGGDDHDGGTLSDTMMVASIDPINKSAAMLSIPRDLYVKIPGHGYGKINAANSYGGPELAMQVVSGILDLPIHYYVQADFDGFRQAVDAVGGVSVTSTEKLYDPEYPCENGRGYCTFNLTPGLHQMDGKLALKYARCRHGLCGNDFGRAARQQQLLAALRQKALEASTLTNPVKMSGLVQSVGDHVRTDFQVKEIQKLASLIKDIDMTKAPSKVLSNDSGGLLVAGDGKYAGAGSILLPAAGDFNYSAIRELAHSIFIDGYLRQENAAVEVQNGTAQDGLGAQVAHQLKAYNYHIVNVTSAPNQAHQTSVVVDYTGGKKPYTAKYLASRFKTKVITQPRPLDANGQPTGPELGIIIGSDYKVAPAPTTNPSL